MDGNEPEVCSGTPPQSLAEMISLVAARRVPVSPKTEAVLRFAFEHPEDVAFLTASRLSLACGVSTATVFRTCSSFGFGNYHDFREVFRSYVKGCRL